MSPAKTREYELVLMLDPEVPEDRREEIAQEARRRIETAGSLKHDSAWGMRKLAYEIRQRMEADYRFFRFETGDELLDELNHNLRIADGVLRFRIFKVDPGSPATVPPPPLSASASQGSRGSRRGSGTERAGSAPAGAPAARRRAEEPSPEATPPPEAAPATGASETEEPPESGGPEAA